MGIELSSLVAVAVVVDVAGTFEEVGIVRCVEKNE